MATKFLSDCQTVLAALDVARQLQAWIDETADGGTQPCATICVTDHTIIVSVGTVDVWDGGDDERSELNVKACVDRYIDELANLGSLVKMAAARLAGESVQP